jgi:phage tail tape-measure protein
VQASTVDGFFFTYLDTVNSGAWSVTTVANSVSTSTSNVTTGTTMTAANWYLLEAEMNAAGTSVTYYINGVTTGVTHVTNIPTGVGRETAFRMQIVKTIGTTTSLLYLDAYYVEMDFTTPR